MLSPVSLANGEINEQKYAIGWRNNTTTKIFGEKREVRVIHHGGVANGSSALLILLPEYNLAVSVAMNRTHEKFDLFETAYQFAKVFINELQLIEDLTFQKTDKK